MDYDLSFNNRLRDLIYGISKQVEKEMLERDYADLHPLRIWDDEEEELEEDEEEDYYYKENERINKLLIEQMQRDMQLQMQRDFWEDEIDPEEQKAEEQRKELLEDGITIEALEELEAVKREAELEYEENLKAYMKFLEEENKQKHIRELKEKFTILKEEKRWTECKPILDELLKLGALPKPNFKKYDRPPFKVGPNGTLVKNPDAKVIEENPGKEIWAMIDPKQYKGNGHAYKEETLKPKATHICNGLRTVKVNIKTIIESLCTGHAVRLGTYGKVKIKSERTGKEYWKFNSDDFKGATAFYIDIDNGGSMERSLRIAKESKLNIAAILPSISFTEENQKHHILFVLDKPINNEVEINNIMEVLVSIFNADTSCDYISKFLYPSWNKPYYTDYAAINNIEYLKDLTNGIKNTKNDEVKNAETVDITGFEANKKSTFESTPILNLYNIYKYKINMGGESNDIYKDGSKLDIPMLDRLFKDEIFVKTYGFKTFNSMEKIKSYLKSIPLEHLLKIDHPSSFKCIFHEDNNPSAAIKMMDNTSVYSCFSNACIGTHNDIFNIVSYVLYGSTDRFMDAFTYIVTALELTVKDIDLDFYKRISEIIKNNRYLVLTANKLGEEFKNVKRKLNSKYTNMLLRTLMDIAEYTLDCCPQLNKAEDLIFTASASFLKDRAGFSSKKMIQERIDDLVAIGFIEQLTDQEVKNININVYNSINALQKKNFYGKAKTINCYKLKRVDTKALAAAEELFKYGKQIGATRKGTSALQNNIIGIEARRKATGSFTGKNKNMFEKLRGWFYRTYNRNKYILKHAYLSYAAKNNIGEKKASQFLTYFNLELGLVKKVVSKDLINKFNIPTTNIRKTVFI